MGTNVNDKVTETVTLFAQASVLLWRMKTIWLAIAALTLNCCTDPPGATDALEAAGYRRVEITGFVYFGCGAGEGYHTAFAAIGQNGKIVNGVVCSGWGWFGKGNTIRTFS